MHQKSLVAGLPWIIWGAYREHYPNVIDRLMPLQPTKLTNYCKCKLLWATG